MQRLKVSGAVRPIYGSLGVKRIRPPNVPQTAQFTVVSQPSTPVNGAVRYNGSQNFATLCITLCRQTATSRFVTFIPVCSGWRFVPWRFAEYLSRIMKIICLCTYIVNFFSNFN